jgi:hypothetical protein
MQTINNRKLDAKGTVERGLDLDWQWTSGASLSLRRSPQ